MYRIFPPKNKYVPKTKEEAGKLIKSEEKTKKLEKQLQALESAYKSKFISEGTFLKNKERVEKQIKRLRG